MGRLIKTPTEDVQKTLQGNLDGLFGNAAPIVSLYAAGRMCRMKVVDGLILAAGFAAFRNCFQQAFAENLTLDAPTAIAMGASMVDDKLRGQFLDPADPKKRRTQFRLDENSQIFTRFTGFLAHPNFIATQSAFLQASTWERACPDRMIWYDKFELAAN